MTKTQVIARQAKRIEEMRDELKWRKAAAREVRNMIYCIGGPLNDNVQKYTPKQMAIFHRIMDALAGLTP